VAGWQQAHFRHDRSSSRVVWGRGLRCHATSAPAPPHGQSPDAPGWSIRDNLTDRIAEAEREGRLGEVEGLRVSLAAAEDKLAQLNKHPTSTTVDLGTPTLPTDS
jgi:hypothetical protein